MENDVNAVQSSVRITETAVHQGSTISQRGTDSGHVAAVAAGNPDFDSNEGSEETPLLGRSHSYRVRVREDPSERLESLSDATRDRSPPTWQGLADWDGKPWYKRPSIFWLLGPFLLYAMAFGGTIVIGLEVVTEFLCREKLLERNPIDPVSSSSLLLGDVDPSDPKFCSKDPQVIAAVSMFMMAAMVCGGVLSAISSPKLGELSDRYGRLRFLALNGVGSLFRDSVFVLLFTFPNAVNVRWLLVAYAVDGICGSFTAGMAISHAYATDCTPPNRRAVAFGWFQGCLFAGIALGPVAAGYVVKLTGKAVYIFYIALAMHMFFIAFVFFCAPESLSKSRQKLAREKKRRQDERLQAEMEGRISAAAAADSAGSRHGWRETLAAIPATSILWLRRHNALAPLKVLFPTGPGSSWALRYNMIILALVDTIMFAVAMGAVTVTIQYVEATFNWGTLETSTFVTLTNSARVTVLLVILPLVTRLVRGGSKETSNELQERGCDSLDKWLIIVGLTMETLGFIGYVFAPTGAVMILSGMMASFGGVGSPTLQSSMTKHVPPELVGQVLGATGLLHSLARIFAPMACNYIFAKTVVIGMPNTVFMVLAGAFGLALVFAFGIKKGVFWDAKAAEEEALRVEREEQVAAAIERREEEDFF